MNRLQVWPLVVVAAAAATARGADTRAGEPPFPLPEWPLPPARSSAIPAPARRDAFRAWLTASAGDSWAGIVIRGGWLVFGDRGPRCHLRQRNDCGSILKPLQATALGVALQQGRLKSLDALALPYWADAWATPFANDRDVTFRQLAQYRDRWNEPEPAGTFHYNNASATAAGACIAGLFTEVRGARPRGITEVVRRQVMGPIGAEWELWYWEQDFVAGDPGNPGPRMVLEASVYELAKLGYLWLRRGDWHGSRLFSEAYYREAVTDWSPDTGSASFGRFGHYGYWWFVNDGRVLLPEAPADAFYAIGNGHPKRATCLLVIPSLELVAVLSMERLSDDGQWDVIRNSRIPSNEGPREFAARIVRLCAP